MNRHMTKEFILRRKKWIDKQARMPAMDVK